MEHARACMIGQVSLLVCYIAISCNVSTYDICCTILQREPGGLFVRPIPGHQLRTVETTPQVRIIMMLSLDHMIPL